MCSVRGSTIDTLLLFVGQHLFIVTCSEVDDERARYSTLHELSPATLVFI